MTSDTKNAMIEFILVTLAVIPWLVFLYGVQIASVLWIVLSLLWSAGVLCVFHYYYLKGIKDE